MQDNQEVRTQGFGEIEFRAPGTSCERKREHYLILTQKRKGGHPPTKLDNTVNAKCSNGEKIPPNQIRMIKIDEFQICLHDIFLNEIYKFSFCFFLFSFFFIHEKKIFPSAFQK